MKNIQRKVIAFFAAFCLVAMNIISVVNAAPVTTVPAISTVEAEAQSTASYVLSLTDFTDLSDTSKFYNASRNLILAIRSGLDCTTETAQYLSTATSQLQSDGTLDVAIADYAYPNDNYVCYAYLISVLALSGQDPTNYNNTDLVTTFDQILSNATVDDLVYGSDSVTYENTGMNPYYLGILYTVTSAYQDNMTHASQIISTITSALTQSIETGYGFEYYGYSADNNGIILPLFYQLYLSDSTIADSIDAALSYTETTFFDSTDGTSHTIYNDYYTGELVDYASPDSTALALALYAQYGNESLAAASYNALNTNYRSTTTAGAYTYYGSDDQYASQDALLGLVTYLYALNGSSNPFDITDAVRALTNSSTNNGSNDTNSDATDNDNTNSANDTSDNESSGNDTSVEASTDTTNDATDSTDTTTENNSGSESESDSESTITSPVTADFTLPVFYAITASISVLVLIGCSKKRNIKNK